MQTEQQQYNEILESTPLKLVPKEEMLALLEKNADTSSQGESYDPIENAMKRHPMLTREMAEQMAKDFGF